VVIPRQIKTAKAFVRWAERFIPKKKNQLKGGVNREQFF
jgi:hypothetical protein